MSRRARRRAALALAAAALAAAAGAFRPVDRWRARGDASDGAAAVRSGDLDKADEAFSSCLARDPSRSDCEAGRQLIARARGAETAWRKEASRADMLSATLKGAVAASGVLPASARRPDAGAPTVLRSQTPAADGGGEDDQRRAVLHWNEGIKAFQKGDMAAARDEWKLCSRFDPSSEECRAGLKRLDNMVGGGL